MPQQKKPPRLYLEPARRYADGRIRSPSVWVIRDGISKLSTGCAPSDHAGAARALHDYLAEKEAAAPVRNKTAKQTSVRDVIAYYLKIQADIARPEEREGRIRRLLAWWGRKTLDDVNGHACRSYVAHRGAPAAARRELEDLRAAIKLYCGDGLCREYVAVTLPEKPRARMSYFTRDQIAALLWHVLTAREVQKGCLTDKRHLRHVAMYLLLLAVYTGTRSSRIWNASFEREPGRPWIDLDGGIFYREAAGEMAPSNKRADPVRIPERLLAHLRRWRRGPLVDGVRKPRRYAVEFRGRPGDPKKAIANAMASVFGEDHPFVRHTFRHTCATWLMWSGEDVGDIASYMSMTREMVVNVYGKEHPDADRSVGEAFSTGRAGRRADRSRRQHQTGSGRTNGHFAPN